MITRYYLKASLRRDVQPKNGTEKATVHDRQREQSNLVTPQNPSAAVVLTAAARSAAAAGDSGWSVAEAARLQTSWCGQSRREKCFSRWRQNHENWLLVVVAVVLAAAAPADCWRRSSRTMSRTTSTYWTCTTTVNIYTTYRRQLTAAII